LVRWNIPVTTKIIRREPSMTNHCRRRGSETLIFSLKYRRPYRFRRSN
jgi:hypothetical protein